MTRADDWARVDYRSRAVAIIGVIATTLVTAVTLTAYGSRPRVVAPYGVGGSDDSLLRVSSILDYLC